MAFTEKDLDNLSQLARITVKPEEKQKMLHDMQSILGYVSEINAVSGSVEREIPELRNVFRDDIITHETGSNTKAVLAEAPATEDNYVKVNQVFK
ncbi:MAG: aspartyl-tRNA(Asn)/glutamyl-tRNA(Gln) amidotransferase subunit [Patescibacteria group bacterium]|nr:aspartyl-tRNA(Asn)/glutamyl-tRNA(Gln) amidotransferase subunit [Patescibacteria group bacterium]